MSNYANILGLRVKRARQHIANFDRASNRFIDSEPYKVVSYHEMDGSDKIVRWHAEMVKPIPSVLGFLLADAVNNLRSVLDNAIWMLGQTCVPKTRSGVSFPICRKRQDFPGGGDNKTLNRLPQGAYTIIEQLQPYHGTNKNEHPLIILNTLWNRDKHRTPTIAVAMHRRTQLQPIGPSIYLENIRMTAGGPIKEGTELMRYTVPAGHPEYGIVGNFTHQIVIDEGRYSTKVTR